MSVSQFNALVALALVMHVRLSWVSKWTKTMLSIAFEQRSKKNKICWIEAKNTISQSPDHVSKPSGALALAKD